MNIRRLVIREIVHGRLNFALGVLSVVVAAGVVVGQWTALRGHDIRTEQILAEKQEDADESMRRMEDEIRRNMKKLGFNIRILPKGQNLGDFYEKGYASKYMPEQYVGRIANSRIFSVRHLLPVLEQRIDWPERKRKIILIGVRGEIPFVHRAPKEPMVQPVAPGRMVMGHELHRSFSVAEGDEVKLMGRTFTVSKCNEERGTRDDITAWIDLAAAQEMLGKTGMINAIYALECRCGWANLAKVRGDILRILPDVQVQELAGRALVRAEARKRAARQHKESLAREKAHRAQLRRGREEFAALVVPLVLVASAVWVGLLALLNVRQRSAEIAVLRAMGVRARQIFTAFLARAVVVGLLGSVIGSISGLVIGMAWGAGQIGSAEFWRVISPLLLAGVILAGPAVSAAACWAPATLAARQDPAVVLQKE